MDLSFFLKTWYMWSHTGIVEYNKKSSSLSWKMTVSCADMVCIHLFSWWVRVVWVSSGSWPLLGAATGCSCSIFSQGCLELTDLLWQFETHSKAVTLCMCVSALCVWPALNGQCPQTCGKLIEFLIWFETDMIFILCGQSYTSVVCQDINYIVKWFGWQ